MLDCQVALLENAIARFYVNGDVPQPLGSRHPAITPFQFFQASDSYIVIAAGNDSLWQKLCSALGLEELAADRRFVDNALRTKNHAELEPLLQSAFSQRSVAEWCDILGAAGIPCGPIHSVAEVCADEQVAARQMIVDLVHPIAGRQTMPNSPFKFSQTPVRLRDPAPTLGQHTEDVLTSLLGLSADEIAELQAEGVL